VVKSGQSGQKWLDQAVAYGQAAVKLWSNFGQTLVKLKTNCGQAAISRDRPNNGQTASKAQTAVTKWTNS
jgi:hypothetical protein